MSPNLQIKMLCIHSGTHSQFKIQNFQIWVSCQPALHSVHITVLCFQRTGPSYHFGRAIVNTLMMCFSEYDTNATFLILEIGREKRKDVTPSTRYSLVSIVT